LFLALVTSVVAVGRTPRCVLEVPELGLGRLSRIIQQMSRCAVSFHDLSRVGVPARFNMPFELGLACALSELRGEHSYALLDGQRFRLQRTLSDLNGRDPYIHNGSVRHMITSVLDALPTTGRTPDPTEVFRVYRLVRLATTELKRRYRATTIFTPALFRHTVAIAVASAVAEGVIEP